MFWWEIRLHYFVFSFNCASLTIAFLVAAASISICFCGFHVIQCYNNDSCQRLLREASLVKIPARISVRWEDLPGLRWSPENYQGNLPTNKIQNEGFLRIENFVDIFLEYPEWSRSQLVWTESSLNWRLYKFTMQCWAELETIHGRSGCPGYLISAGLEIIKLRHGIWIIFSWLSSLPSGHLVSTFPPDWWDPDKTLWENWLYSGWWWWWWCCYVPDDQL